MNSLDDSITESFEKALGIFMKRLLIRTNNNDFGQKKSLSFHLGFKNIFNMGSTAPSGARAVLEVMLRSALLHFFRSICVL